MTAAAILPPLDSPTLIPLDTHEREHFGRPIGYSMEFDMQRHYRVPRASTIAASSSQIQRNLIAGAMGLKVQQ
jgi:alkylation response protein AidB-like acyl-CoA dehydrogenase